MRLKILQKYFMYNEYSFFYIYFIKVIQKILTIKNIRKINNSIFFTKFDLLNYKSKGYLPYQLYEDIIEIISKNNTIESSDVTVANNLCIRGIAHPINETIYQLTSILSSMGFVQVVGNEIEYSWNNFTALNISKNHSARQKSDTFYINSSKILRTHTSNVQIKHMIYNKPPTKVFSIGKVYRVDQDSTHYPMFHQLECLVINENKVCSIKILKSFILKILINIFNNRDIKLRMRKSHFPFTEPSFELDIYSKSINNHWLEILGCGIVNKNVFLNMGINPLLYSGFAIGIGVERLTMIKKSIINIKDFNY